MPLGKKTHLHISNVEMNICIKYIMINFIGFLVIILLDMVNVLTLKPRSVKAIV